MHYTTYFLGREKRLFGNKHIQLKNGAFAGINSIDIELKAGKLNRQINTKTFMPFSAANRQVLSQVAKVDCQPYGINRLLVDTNGAFVPDKFIEEWSKSLKFNRNEFQSLASVIHTLPKHDSHLNWILNMVITATITQMVVTDKSYDPERKAMVLNVPEYADSHFARAFNEAGPMSSFDLRLAPLEQAHADLPRITKYTEFFDIVLPNLSGPGLNFALSHLRGRKKTTPLNIDFNLPYCGELNACIEFDMQPNAYRQQYPLDDYRFMWGTIATIVKFLRIEHEFMAAMQIVACLMFLPEPDTIEGTIWKDTPLYVHIPPFASLRSNHEFIRGGEPYRMSEVDTSMPAITPDPFVTIISHAFVNAYAYAGYFDVFARCGLRGDPLQVLQSEFIQPETSFMAAASHASGIQVASYFQPGTGITIGLDTIRLGAAIPVRDAQTNQALSLKLTYMPTPCNVSFLLGKVPGGLSTYAHLADFSISCDPSDDIPLKRMEVMRMAQFARLCGYDSAYYDLHTEQELQLWAAQKSKVIQPMSVPFYQVEHLYKLQDYQERENSKNIPALETLLEVGFDVAYTAQVVSLVSLDSREALHVTVMKTPPPSPIKFLVETPYSVNHYKLPYAPYPGSYFQDATVKTGAPPSTGTSQLPMTSVVVTPDATPEAATSSDKPITPGTPASPTTYSSVVTGIEPPTVSMTSSRPTRLVAGDFSLTDSQ